MRSGSFASSSRLATTVPANDGEDASRRCRSRGRRAAARRSRPSCRSRRSRARARCPAAPRPAGMKSPEPPRRRPRAPNAAACGASAPWSAGSRRVPRQPRSAARDRVVRSRRDRPAECPARRARRRAAPRAARASRTPRRRRSRRARYAALADQRAERQAAPDREAEDPDRLPAPLLGREVDDPRHAGREDPAVAEADDEPREEQPGDAERQEQHRAGDRADDEPDDVHPLAPARVGEAPADRPADERRQRERPDDEPDRDVAGADRALDVARQHRQHGADREEAQQRRREHAEERRERRALAARGAQPGQRRRPSVHAPDKLDAPGTAGFDTRANRGQRGDIGTERRSAPARGSNNEGMTTDALRERRAKPRRRGSPRRTPIPPRRRSATSCSSATERPRDHAAALVAGLEQLGREGLAEARAGGATRSSCSRGSRSRRPARRARRASGRSRSTSCRAC